MIAVLLATLLASATPVDTVYTADGGRITGAVLEESPTTGVVIQTADGTVHRIDRSQISRIEFADGTVSNVQQVPLAPAVPPAPVPAVAASPAPRAAAPEGALDNVYFRGGGRVRGTVMEEGPTAVKVRLLDGSIQAYAMDELTRIEYADGTVSTPRAPAPRPAEPAAAPARPKAPEAAPVDTVYFLGSGRVRGTVIEENPRTGVKVRLLDGSVHTYARDELQRIEYADGSVSRRVAPAARPVPVVASQPPQPPQTAPVYPIPPAYPVLPPPPRAVPPPPRTETAQPSPLFLSLGIGATILSADAQSSRTMASVFQTEQAHVSGELGVRLTPGFAIGAYGDVGGGDPSQEIRDQCRLQALDCTAMTGRVGVMARHTWSPLSTRPVWLSLGTGWEVGSIVAETTSSTGSTGSMGSSSHSDYLRYTGREIVRVGAGIDFRSNSVVGLGLYGTFAVGEYDKLKDQTGVTTSIDSVTHTTAQVGLRLTLFP